MVMVMILYAFVPQENCLPMAIVLHKRADIVSGVLNGTHRNRNLFLIRKIRKLDIQLQRNKTKQSKAKKLDH